ncbi:MAG: uroporphyrinogen-III synthase [Chloroflexi bacterium]|nr:uroporphyrinogen-III synthase [Chloroflexota bacterium]MCY4248668.1 uroporphyrinogen-III synthase [Chloroflexota bacterium]
MSADKSLAGARIVVTRARRQAEPMAKLICERGGVPLLYPCLAIVPPDNFLPLADALCHLSEFDWLVFTSVNAVAAVADRLRTLASPPNWSQLSIAVVGPQTRDAVKIALGRDVDFLPEQANARLLAHRLPLPKAARLLLPQADQADASTAQIFRERGAAVTPVIAYRTVVGSGGIDLGAQLAQGDVHALTFASPSAVDYLLQRCPQPRIFALPAACIGATTAEAARRQGFDRLIVPKVSGLSKMLDSLAQFFLTHPKFT